MKKEIAKIKTTAKNDVDYIGKITTKLLQATDFSNKQILEIIKKLVELVAEAKNEEKNDKLIEKISTIKEAIDGRKNEVKILNELGIKKPKWIDELKPNSTKKIEERLDKIKKAVREIVIPEIKIPERVDLKKPKWWDIKEITSSFSISIKKIENILSHKIFKIKSENPLDVVITDRRGKAIDLSLLGGIITGGGVEKVNIKDENDNTINPATEDKQDDLITELQKKADVTETQPVSASSLPLPSGAATSAKQLPNDHDVTVSNQITGFATSAKQDDLITAVQLDITKAINEINFDLNASAFSETTNLTGDYILDNIEFNFSTEEEKTITVKTTTGTTIWEDTNTEKSVFLSNMNIALSENIIIEVTQFTSAGTMSCIARTK